MSEPRIRETLARLAGRPPAEWTASLARAFPDDPEIRRQALLWLHAEQHAVRGEDAPPALSAPAQQRYELSICLDAGATASVWQAFDHKLGRNVAIKVFHEQGGSDRASDAIEQVFAEARAASDVISDYVVRVLDVHDDDARPYIVMELVGEHDPARGEIVLGTAASACHPEDFEEVARWVMQVARGVHDAHLRNVFHRDLKPQNVLIAPISRRARVADFGLAISGAAAHTGHASMTLSRRGPVGPVSVRGTPRYMAPEQAQGLPVGLDPRAAADRATLVAVDVWGLGAIAYDLLSGSPPWRGSDDLAAWEMAASGEAPRRLARTRSGARISPRLRRIVEKALAHDPRARYGTAAQLANELQAYLAGCPTTQDRSRPLRVGLWCRRNPQLALTAMVALALTLLAFTTHATVTRLRGQRDALRDEAAEIAAEQVRLTERVDRAHAELEATQHKLEAARANLTALEASIVDDRKSYETIVEVKERALHDANQATRELIEQLDAARRDRVAAEQARATYEQLSADTRKEADRAAKDRDHIRQDRDAARAERDALQRERDTIEHERDAAIAQRDRAIAERELAARKLAAAQGALTRRKTGDAEATRTVRPIRE